MNSTPNAPKRPEASSRSDTIAQAGGGAHDNHWNKPEAYSPEWDARAAIAATLITPGLSVLDVGCGRMALQRLLPNGCTYIAADLTKWTPAVIVVDLNRGEFPPGAYDHIVMLGVLEYLHSPAGALAAARAGGGRLIVSYCHPNPGALIERRRRWRWINDLSEAEFAKMLSAAGWSVAARKIYKTTQAIREAVYLCI